MRLTQHLHKCIAERLNEHRIIVWYDCERAFGDFVASFQAPNCRVISAAGSRLHARRDAEAVYRQLNASESPQRRPRQSPDLRARATGRR